MNEGINDNFGRGATWEYSRLLSISVDQIISHSVTASAIRRAAYRLLLATNHYYPLL